MRRIIAAAFAAAVTLVPASPPAFAHAFLDHASPAVGSTIPAAPAAISLSFTQDLEAAFSSVSVTNEAGQRVDLGNAQVPPGAPAELRVELRPLPPGTYTVRWRVVSVDTHPTEGRFQFTVAR